MIPLISYLSFSFDPFFSFLITYLPPDALYNLSFFLSLFYMFFQVIDGETIN